MNLFGVGAGVLNQTPLDWDGNERRIFESIKAAREQNISLLCLPELCITGYGCEDAFQSPSVQREALRSLERIAEATEGLVVTLGLPLLVRKALYNTVALVADGEILGFAAKQHLAGDGLHYEPRWFKPWPEGEWVMTEIHGRDLPVGDLVFDVGGVSLGFEICEDAWVATRTGRSLALQGVDIILNPSASHFAFGKQDIRERYVLEGSRSFHVTYVYTNLLGNEAGRSIYDGGALIANHGRMVARGSRFSFEEWAITAVVVDLDLSRMGHSRLSSYQPRLGQSPENRVEVPFNWPILNTTEPRVILQEEWEKGTRRKDEEFTRAVALALFDYVRKSRSRGFVVSLSGGADSAAVACLVALALRLAVEELGLETVKNRLAYMGESVRSLTGPEDLVRQLLSCVYQATRNSSEATERAARTLAEGLGATYYRWDVDALVGAYEAVVEESLGRKLTWEDDDIARQNIQARVRAPSVWMLANIRGALLLATSNRSEAAVGYATMDGDTAGGLSPIAGIDKAFLREWLRFMEREGPAGLGSIPALSAVNQLVPTAELRPLERNQTDEQDLMPYPLLDAVEKAAIRDKRDPVEVYRSLQPRFPQYSGDQLARWIARFFRLFARNQWKRERYAPSFHVDDENLDPKTWCRFPILSGGFERELKRLEAYVREET